MTTMVPFRAKSTEPTLQGPSVAVVIVNFRTPAQTIACVRSLERQRYPNLSIIVVDNDSRDGSAAEIKESLPGVALIRASSNGGYTEGNNLGIEAALARGADYVLILNPDTLSINHYFIKKLVEFAESRPRCGAVGPRVFWHSRDEVQNTVLVFPWLHRRVWGWMRTRLTGKPMRSVNHPRRAEVLNGVCVLFRSEALREVGVFDTRTFAYIEDVDWGYRAERLGWDRWYAPIDAIIHEQKKTGYERGSAVEFLLKRNTLYFLLKTGHRLQAAVYTAATYVPGIMSLRPGRGAWLARLEAAYRGLWSGDIDRVMGRPMP
jgi:GT2 family glycosyltransferase